MKILQINAVYGYGSTGIITKDIMECALQSGIESFVAYPKGLGEAEKNFYEIGNVIDRKLHAILCRIGGKQAYYSRCATHRLIHYIDTIQPDIVHLHNLHSNYIYLNLLLKYLAEKQIKTVVTMHDCWYFTGGCFHYTAVGCKRWQNGCGRCIKQRQDIPAYLYDASSFVLKDRIKYFSAIPNITFVGVSKWTANEMRKSMLRDVGNVTYIYNGIDIQVFYPRESNLKTKLGLEGKKVILAPASKWLSSISKPAFDHFAKQLASNCVLLLFGYNKEANDLPSNVMVYGYTRSRDELAGLYSMADVMANCSYEDTLSCLNLEVQACGTPIVTFDATGLKETVDGKCGFAVETGNYQLMFDKVMEVLRLGKECFRNDLVKMITNNFEKTSNYVKYIDLYKELCGV